MKKTLLLTALTSGIFFNPSMVRSQELLQKLQVSPASAPPTIQASQTGLPQNIEPRDFQAAQRSIHSTEKSTAIASRLIASYTGYGNAANMLQIYDSVDYTYSGNRGMDNYGIPLSDTETRYNINANSLLFLPSLRYISCYNGANHDTFQILQQFTGGIWDDVIQTHHYPDASGRDTLMQIDAYDPTSNSFLPNLRIHNGYDALGNVLLSMKENYSGGSWSGYYRMTYTYNGVGKILSEVIETGSAGVWTGNARYTNTYSATNKPLVQLTENFNSGAWYGSSRITYAYDAGDNDISTTTETYSSQWNNTGRHLYTYDATHNMTSDVDQNWSSATQSWISTNVHFYTYNAANQLTSTRTEAQCGPNFSLANFDSTANILDASGNIIQQLHFFANGTGGWLQDTRTTYTFTAGNKPATELDETFNRTSSAFQNVTQLGYAYNSFGENTRAYKLEWVNGAWVYGSNSYEKRYYYESYNSNLAVAGIGGISRADIQLYPVPANNEAQLIINFSKPQAFTAIIVDAAGKKVQSWQDYGNGTYMHNIFTNTLAAGVYYLSIRGSNIDASRPLVVRH